MKFDIAIIGGGPGGYTAAEKAAKAGRSVVLFEKEDLGGTCLNRGCMPTKALLHSAETYAALGHAQDLGVQAQEIHYDFAAMHQRKDQVVATLRQGVEKLMKASKVTVVAGQACIQEAGLVTCQGETYEVGDIIIATGSQVSYPPIPGLRLPGVYNSRDILEGGGQNFASLVIVGGGVVGDLAGFAAATILRGVDFVQIPTTLLAQVDSSVGGKVAIDLHAGKNLAGAFCQPAAVICDTDCLKTLPPDVFADGAAEAVKTGVLSDEALFALFEDGTLTADPGEVIARCVAYKAGVVERDEKEQGERKLLNLGHTVGHAIEKCSGYVIPHGHAVAAGLAVIARAAEALGWTEESLAARITACLSKNGLPTGTDYSAEALAEAALSDKKRAGGDITLVVPRKIGHCELRKVPVADLLPIIRAGLEA